MNKVIAVTPIPVAARSKSWVCQDCGVGVGVGVGKKRTDSDSDLSLKS
jgi:hypothetical protein